MIFFPIRVRFMQTNFIILGRRVGFGYPLSIPLVRVKKGKKNSLF
jgi:hypothetical protein